MPNHQPTPPPELVYSASELGLGCVMLTCLRSQTSYSVGPKELLHFYCFRDWCRHVVTLKQVASRVGVES